MTEYEFENALMQRHGIENQQKISQASVGIAGLGGLGSNIAFFLARCGIGKLVLVDFDTVDISNLNRQQYRICDIGKPKPRALVDQLMQINPYSRYETHFEKVTPENMAELFGECNVLCEAFDKADQKAMMAETVLCEMPEIPLVSASGMAGFGSANRIHTVQKRKNFYLCGDGESDIEKGIGLIAPRVAVCAAHQAMMALRLILGKQEP